NEPRTRNDLLRWIAGELGMAEPAMAEMEHGESKPSERGGNRRYRNQRLRDAGYTFKYPTFREGYGALIAERKSAGA
ncbi:MAG: SDR family NAD(P)-dependent oxidoreductase, partial [Candidatus Hydrogenedentes bacterium]|nr:SDR family NAD(P)-dependent oxidoreductase [Candidatus Hydrogenedentota bacterium]